jgi:hypothetical protein
MLAGRNDVSSLAYYTKQFQEYSDDGKILNGAYGYRWRNANTYDSRPQETDQLNLIAQHLKANPQSRRAVLAMWSVENDLLNVGSSKDVCCNLNVMFSLRKEVDVSNWDNFPPEAYYLDMTVTNRSNDMIWGLLGANYVTFSILQEYMAARLGVEVGVYHHFTNNLHVYDWNWKPKEWLEDVEMHSYPTEDHKGRSTGDYLGNGVHWKNRTTIVKDPTVFDQEVKEFVEHHSKCADVRPWSEPFLKLVAEPMMIAYHWYKKTDKDRFEPALEVARRIKADDWRITCLNWLQRRKKPPSLTPSRWKIWGTGRV